MIRIAILSTYKEDFRAFQHILGQHTLQPVLIRSGAQTKEAVQQGEAPDMLLCTMSAKHPDFLDLYYWLSNTSFLADTRLTFIVGTDQESIINDLSRSPNVTFLYRPIARDHLIQYLNEQIQGFEQKKLSQDALPQAMPSTPQLMNRLQGKIKSVKIERELGRGGSGVVLLGYQESLDRKVAIKVLSKEHDFTAQDVERLKQEARLIANIKHEHIVQCYDAGFLEDGSFYIMMEYVSGQNVEEALEQHGIFSEAEAASIILQVAKGLDAAHRNGLIHRDIKPSNLLIDEQGQVTITDFGLAVGNGAGRMTKTGIIMGTPYYLSPEQALSQPLTPKVDLYSLGIVFYELLTGRLPVEQDNIFQAVIQRLQKEAFDPREKNPAINPHLANLVVQLTQKDPNKRMGSCQELIAQLNVFLGRTPDFAAMSSNMDFGAYATPLPAGPSMGLSTSKSSPLSLLSESGSNEAMLSPKQLPNVNNLMGIPQFEQSQTPLPKAPSQAMMPQASSAPFSMPKTPSSQFSMPQTSTSQLSMSTGSMSQASTPFQDKKKLTAEMDLARALEQALKDPSKLKSSTQTNTRFNSGAYSSGQLPQTRDFPSMASQSGSSLAMPSGQFVSSAPQQSDFDNLLQQAKKSYIQRDYKTSLSYFERCLAYKPNDKSVLSNIEKLKKRLELS